MSWNPAVFLVISFVISCSNDLVGGFSLCSRYFYCDSKIVQTVKTSFIHCKKKLSNEINWHLWCWKCVLRYKSTTAQLNKAWTLVSLKKCYYRVISARTSVVVRAVAPFTSQDNGLGPSRFRWMSINDTQNISWGLFNNKVVIK
jgi:hypothetical protein